MFKKTMTTVKTNGETIEHGVLARMHVNDVPADMARERRAVRNNTELGRVANIENTMTTLVVVYTSGRVVVFNWSAE